MSDPTLQERYAAAKVRQREALQNWQQLTYEVSRLREELGETGELDCEGCGKAKATWRARGCGRWYCNEACHKEHC